MVPSSGNSQHIPVMADEIVSYLVTESSGAYLDLTAGLGGHLLALSEKLSSQASLYGVDRDKEALAKAEENLKDVRQESTFWHGSYRETEQFREYFKIDKFDGILLDLGLSSLQIDDRSRAGAPRHRSRQAVDIRERGRGAQRSDGLVENGGHVDEVAELHLQVSVPLVIEPG